MRREGGVSKDARCFGHHHFSHILKEVVERACRTEVKQRVEDQGKVARREGTVDQNRIQAQNQKHRHQSGGVRIEAIPLRQSEQGGDEIQGVPKE